jgi:hypothetical protein
MDNLPKPKKTSFAIQIIDFVLGIAIFGLAYSAVYIWGAAPSAFNFQDMLKYAFESIKGYNYQSFSAYFLLLAFVGPVIGGILGLFGRTGRAPNIIAFFFFVFSPVYVLTDLIARGVNQVFNFGSVADTCYSLTIICGLVGLVLSQINLNRSK